jgi:hypothetical protein
MYTQRLVVIARFRSDPCVALAVLPQPSTSPEMTRKSSVLGVRVKWNRDPWWDRAPEHTKIILCVLWRCQKFYCWSEKFEDFASARILLKNACLNLQSFSLLLNQSSHTELIDEGIVDPYNLRRNNHSKNETTHKLIIKWGPIRVGTSTTS